MIKAVLFDLDGTLLPMDQEVFTKSYFGRLSARMAKLGYEPSGFIRTVWECTAQMIANDGSRTNEEVFWSGFCRVYGPDARKHEAELDRFYRTEFQEVSADCGFDPNAAAAVRAIKDRGIRVIVATNPFFPRVATESRLRWAGLEPSEFELCTTYEDSHYSKPNPSYYREILQGRGLRPEECLMVGNDVEEDMVAGELGMRTFLVTPCLLNKKGRDISVYDRGELSELVGFIDGCNG